MLVMWVYEKIEVIGMVVFVKVIDWFNEYLIECCMKVFK